MNNNELRNNHIREYIRYYLRMTNSPGYAVMIRGQWGIGKTFLIKNILSEEFPEDQGYIYVSLYGVAKTEEIDTAILSAMYPLLKTKAAKLTGRLINAASKYLQIDDTLNLSDVIEKSTMVAYVFDDIERSSMKFDEIFGYINHLVEQAGCRVILIANELELEKAKGYRAKREKLVGHTLEAKSEVESALDSFLQQVNDSEARNYIKSVSVHIVALYEQGSVNNLRVLKQTLWDFERFYIAIEPHRRKNTRAMLNILRLLFALSFEIKLGRIDNDDIIGRSRNLFFTKNSNDKENSIKQSFDRYSGINLSDTTLSDDLLTDLLVRGIVDQEIVKRDLNASSWFLEPNDEPSWRTIWHLLQREIETVENAISVLQHEMAAYKYREPGEILHIFGIMLMMSDAKMIPEDLDSVVQSAKLYITELRKRSDLRPLDSSSIFENIRHGSWGGLGFAEADTPQFTEISRFLNDQRKQASIDRLPALAALLMTELNDDPDLFCRRLVGPGGNQSDLIEGPVLKEIDPNMFLAAILSQTAAVQSEVFQCLMARYGRGGFDRGLEEERAWAKTFHNAIIQLAENSEPVQRRKLTNFASWIGKNVETMAISE
jgi:hypothetical protein